MKISPEELKKHYEAQSFVQSNDLMTKQEFLQMQKDQRAVETLLSQGASQHQVDRVREVSNFGKYSSMTITEIYKDLYGSVPKKKPKVGVKQKGRTRVATGGQYTAEAIKNMSYEDIKKNYRDIMEGYYG